MTLAEARFKKRLTQWDLRIRTGIHQSKISLIERGYVSPRDEEKRKLAEALGCSVEDLFPETAEDVEGACDKNTNAPFQDLAFKALERFRWKEPGR